MALPSNGDLGKCGPDLPTVAKRYNIDPWKVEPKRSSSGVKLPSGETLKIGDGTVSVKAISKEEYDYKKMAPYKTGVCPNQYKNTPIQTDGNKKAQCANCGKFVSKYYLQAHQRTRLCQSRTPVSLQPINITTAPSTSKRKKLSASQTIDPEHLAPHADNCVRSQSYPVKIDGNRNVENQTIKPEQIPTYVDAYLRSQSHRVNDTGTNVNEPVKHEPNDYKDENPNQVCLEMNQPSTSYTNTNINTMLGEQLNTNPIEDGPRQHHMPYNSSSSDDRPDEKMYLVDDEQDDKPNIANQIRKEKDKSTKDDTNLMVEKELSNTTLVEEDTYGRKRQKFSYNNSYGDILLEARDASEFASIPSSADQQAMTMEASDAIDAEINTTADDQPADSTINRSNTQQYNSDNFEELIEPQVIMKDTNVLGKKIPTMNWLSDVANTKRVVVLGKSIEKICTPNDDMLYDSLRSSYQSPANKQVSENSRIGPKKYESYKTVIENGSFGLYSEGGIKRNVKNLYSIYNSVAIENTQTTNQSRKNAKDKNLYSSRPDDFSTTVNFVNIFTKGVAVPGYLMIYLLHKFAPVLQKIQQHGDHEADFPSINPLDETVKKNYKCGDVRPQTSTSTAPCQCTFSEIKSRRCSNYYLYETLISIVVTTAIVRIYARFYALSKNNNCTLTTKEVQRLVKTAQLLDSPIEFPDVDFAKERVELNKYLPLEESVQRLYTVARWYLVTALKIQEKTNERKCSNDTPVVSKTANVFAKVKFVRNLFAGETKSFPNSLSKFNAHLSSDEKDIRVLAALESFRTTLDRNALGFFREYILKTICQLTEKFLVNKDRAAIDILTEFEPMAEVFADIYNNGESLETNLHNLNSYLFATGKHPLSLIVDPDEKPTTAQFKAYIMGLSI